MPGPGMVGMTMGYERTRHRPHGIDVEAAGRAPETFRRRAEEFFGTDHAPKIGARPDKGSVSSTSLFASPTSSA